jgi:cobalamin biosynthetic protein CobC
MPALSVASFADRDGLIVLRSIGKFFGLAGARVGFVLAGLQVDEAMRSLRGPWTVAGPARAATRAALLDHEWQARTRVSLAAAGERLARLLGRYFAVVQHTPLFAWVRDERAAQWHDGLARHGVWTRRFDVVPGLRFGLPADESGWARLEAALEAVRGGQVP